MRPLHAPIGQQIPIILEIKETKLRILGCGPFPWTSPTYPYPTTPRPGCFFLFGHYSVLSLIDGIVTPGDLDQTSDRVAESHQDLSCQEHVGAHHRMIHGVMIRRHLLRSNRAQASHPPRSSGGGTISTREGRSPMTFPCAKLKIIQRPDGGAEAGPDWPRNDPPSRVFFSKLGWTDPAVINLPNLTKSTTHKGRHSRQYSPCKPRSCRTSATASHDHAEHFWKFIPSLL